MANKLKIKKGDRVKVITGRSKGKVGDVLRVLADGAARRRLRREHDQAPHQAEPDRVRAASSNARPRSTSPTWPCSIRNRNKPTRVGFRFLEDGRKVRFARASGETIDR